MTPAPEQREFLLNRAMQALEAGRISKEEYRYYVTNVLGILDQKPRPKTSPEKRNQGPVHLLIGVIAISALLLGFYLALTATQGTLTGSVIFQPTVTEDLRINTTYSENATIAENMSGIGLRASGTLTNGSAALYVVENGTRHLLWQGTAELPAYAVLTDKESYALNETVQVTVLPSNTNRTLWLEDSNGARQLVNVSFLPETEGEYKLDALINDSGQVELASVTFIVRNDADPALDVMRGAPSVMFAAACVATCELQYANATVVAELEKGATLTLSALHYGAERENRPPVQLAPLSDVSVMVGESVNVDLGPHFADPDGDELTYDYMAAPGTSMRVEGSTLTITGLRAGTTSSLIYATDLYSLVQSESFAITVTAANASNVSAPDNTTQSQSLPPVNITQSLTINTTSIPDNNVSSSCTDPDPNKRAPECFIGQESKYFKEDYSLIVENRRRDQVARFNALGNLLLAGRVVARSLSAPGSEDFSVGYGDEDDNFIITAWIETETGDLHLRGDLHEENVALQIPSSTYSFQSRKGINLGYIDPRSGDLYIRGNVIPYRDLEG